MSLDFVLSGCTAVYFHSVVGDGICSSEGKFMAMKFDSDWVSQACNVVIVSLKGLVISVKWSFIETKDLGHSLSY